MATQISESTRPLCWLGVDRTFRNDGCCRFQIYQEHKFNMRLPNMIFVVDIFSLKESMPMVR